MATTPRGLTAELLGEREEVGLGDDVVDRLDRLGGRVTDLELIPAHTAHSTEPS
jgi:hypothetical protein